MLRVSHYSLPTITPVIYKNFHGNKRWIVKLCDENFLSYTAWLLIRAVKCHAKTIVVEI